MKRIYIKIQNGKDLPIQTIKQVDEIWQKAFPGNEPVKSGNKKLFAKDIFFIVRNSKQILSAGRLRPVKVKFLGKFYKIQGIADIVSVIKKKGYGKILMQAMRKYLSRRKQTGVGFCSRKNSPFYQKCGFKVTKNLNKQFLYKNPKGKIAKGRGDLLYSSGSNSFMKKLLSHPKEKVLIPFPHW